MTDPFAKLAKTKPKPDATITRMAKLFTGLDRAHGQYQVDDNLSKGKNKKGGKALTIGEPATTETWRDHLSGKVGLGIIPITDDATCHWACIDVDTYDGDAVKQCHQFITEQNWPLVVCRSKSGGAHVLAFFSEGVSAKTVNTKLAKLATAMGHDGCEIFPKQTKLEEGGVGNWLNMPYFDHEVSTRYGLDAMGKRLDLIPFLDFAESRLMTAEQLTALKVPTKTKPKAAGDYADGPPCLQDMIDARISDGRNEALMHFSVYAKDKHGDDWRDAMLAFNAKLPMPLTEKELNNTVLKSAARKDYGYACNKQPMKHFCDKSVCAKRRFGNLGPINEETDKAKNAACNELNQKYAVAKRGGKVAIVEQFRTTMGKERRIEYRFFKPSDLAIFEANNLIEVGDRPVPKFKLWMEHPERRTYESMIMDPSRDCGYLGNGVFNMWAGFPYEPKAGSIPYFDELVNEIICDGNAELAEYFWKWKARGIQRPGLLGEVALAMLGGQGIGKGMYARTYGRLFGNHWYHFSKTSDLLADFNMHMVDLLFGFADEAVRPKSSVQASQMKAIITEPSLSIQAKFIDVTQMRNRLKLMFATNQKQVADIEGDDRRFVVTNVSEKMKGNFDWFDNVVKEMDGGGMNVLMHRLLHEIEVTDWNHRLLPKTAAKDAQKDLSLNAFESFWYDSLHEGNFGGAPFEFERVPIDVIWETYLTHRQRSPNKDGPESKAIFARDYVRMVLPENYNPRRRASGYEWPRGQQRSGCWYNLPTIDVCRAEFEKYLGRVIEWPKDIDDGNPTF